MIRSRTGAAFLVAAAIVACGSPKLPSATPGAPPPLMKSFRDAFREEAIGDPERAKQAYLHALELAALARGDAWQLPVVDAALDALVGRSVSALGHVTGDSALAYRTREGNLAAELERVRALAKDPFSPAVFARALEDLAEHRGDAAAASKWRMARGCAQEATVVGPVAWTTVTGLRDADPLERHDAAIDATYRSPGPFALPLAPVVVRGRGCAIPLEGASALPGLREVVVDVDVPRAQRVGLGLRANTAAVLRAGGRIVIDRAYELGGGEAAQRALVDVTAGRLRLVAKIGLVDGSGHVEIDVWDEHGEPLRTSAPAPGSAANVAVSDSSIVAYAQPASEEERLAFAAGALANGGGRLAERALVEVAQRADAQPDLALAFARAAETAKDLSPVKRAERARAAYERVLEVWPSAWEAILAHAVLAGVRRGSTEARMEALRDLELLRPAAGVHARPLLDAFDAATSGKERLVDRAAAALERARAPLGATSLFVDVQRSAIERVGAERVSFACADAFPAARNTLDCFDAVRATGDRAASARELDRVRAVLGTPDGYLGLGLQEALNAGDITEARRLFGRMAPGERTLSAFYALVSREKKDGGDGKDLAMLRELALSAGDAPHAIGPLARSLGDDPLAAFAGKTEQVTAEDRATPILPDAATAVLAHTERYEISPRGLVHAVLYDVRRVGGTTDVEQNAQADGPELIGRSTVRTLRRRIFKKDGRVLEPDRTANASQGHADLAQLEKGDTVEAIYEGWAVPGDTGDIGIDTPDLLPDRTAVHDASISVTLPGALTVSLWSHPMLGKATDQLAGTVRTLRWSIRDRGVRRLEDGVPRMDRSVGVSLATAQWSEVAHALRETMASLEEHSSELAAWAKDAAKNTAPKSRALVEAVVLASGKAVREGSASLLSDYALGRPRGPQGITVRTILTEHQGSRSWLISRALRELGVSTEIAIAEDLPFSSHPSFPPHFGRFVHPLVVAHLGGSGGVTDDVWIDADVAGPPLPAGRISPELRGRDMLRADGAIVPVPAASPNAAPERDEIDLRLTLDAKGDARGSFAILLRGRNAQEMSEALVRIVGAERQRALRGVVLAWVPFANVDEVVLSSSEGSWQVALRAEVTASGYAQIEGTTPGARTWALPGMDPLHFVIPRPRVSSLGAFYASQGSRENALAINSAVQFHVHRRIELPAGSTVSRMPGPFEVRSPHLEAARKFKVSGAVMEDEFVMSVPTGTIPAAEYGAFVTDAHKTDDAFLATTWVKPGG